MIRNDSSVFKIFIGYILLFAGFIYSSSLSGSLAKLCWAGFFLIGFPIFLTGYCQLIKSAFLGKPIPFYKLNQNQVYQVVAKISEIQAILIGKVEEIERGEMESTFFMEKIRLVGIPDSLSKDLEKGEKFVRVANTIAKLPS